MATITKSFVNDPIGLRKDFTEDDLQIVIKAIDKQVLGNAHLMENEGLTIAESLLRNGVSSQW